jgi:hypothetical protein
LTTSLQDAAIAVEPVPGVSARWSDDGWVGGVGPGASDLRPSPACCDAKIGCVEAPNVIAMTPIKVAAINANDIRLIQVLHVSHRCS